MIESNKKIVFCLTKVLLMSGVISTLLFSNHKIINAKAESNNENSLSASELDKDKNSDLKEQAEDISIKNIWNLRDLGLHKTCEGGTTKKYAFLRSSVPAFLDDEDIKNLKDYGLRTVIDLRTDREVGRLPSKLANVEGIKYHNISLWHYDKNSKLETVPASESYVWVLDQKSSIKEIFETIADAEEGTILFNCFAGRDRTAVVAMIILSLADVKEEEILSDYLKTFENIRDMPEYKERVAAGKYKELSSDEELSKEFLLVMKHIKDTYGSTEEYLLDCGLTNESIKSIKAKIIQEV